MFRASLLAPEFRKKYLQNKQKALSVSRINTLHYLKECFNVSFECMRLELAF